MTIHLSKDLERFVHDAVLRRALPQRGRRD